MRGNNIITRELLVEYYGQGTFAKVLNKTKESFSAYGEVLTNAFGLVLGDSLYLAKLTFTRLKANETYNKWATNNKTRRQKQLSNLKTSTDKLKSGALEAALLLGPVAPHLMLSDKLFRTACLDDEGVNNFIENSGLINLPGVSAVYALFDRGIDFDGDDIQGTLNKILGAVSDEDEESFVGKAWNITQKIFLLDFSEASFHNGPLLLEGEDQETNSTESSDDFWKKILKGATVPDTVSTIEDFQAWVYSVLIKENVPDPTEYLNQRAADQQEIIDVTKRVLEAYCELIVCENTDELFTALGKLNDGLDKKVDLDKIRSEIDDAVQKAMQNEKVAKEWESLDEKNEKLEGDAKKKAFEEYVRGGVIVTAKGKILPSIRPLFEDTQDILKDRILEGATPELVERFQKYEETKPLAAQITDGLNQIKNIIEPLMKKAETTS